MRKVFAAIFCAIMIFSISCPAYAVTYDEGSAEIQETEPPTPRAITKEYELYYTLNSSYQKVAENKNPDIFAYTYVTVSLTETSGPTAFDIKVSWKKDGAATWEESETGTIDMDGDACSFTIPEDYTFKVEAKATDGKNGYATIQIVLS